MTRVRLALAVPYHSRPDYLRETLASVLTQEDPDWSLTVIDDSGRPGAAAELVAAFGERRFTCLANATNLGMVPTWNRALAEVEPAAELLTILHADDRLRPGYVGAMKALAERAGGAAALFCAARTIGADGRTRLSLQDDVKRLYVPRGGHDVELTGEAGLAALMRANFVVCPTLAWRRARLAGRGFDARWRQVQDLDLMARLLLAGEQLVGLRAAHYDYRRHADNATARQTRDHSRFEEEFALFDEVARAAAQRGWTRAARVARSKTILRLHLGWRALGALLGLRPREAWAHVRRASGP